MEVCTFEGDSTGRGVRARCGISRGDVIVSVPLDAVLTHRQLVGQCGAVEEVDFLGDSDALVAVLILERRLARCSTAGSSVWTEYVKMLPEMEPILAVWSEDDLEALGDDDLVSTARRQRREIVALRERIEAVIGAVELQDVQWAVSIVTSRSCFLCDRGWADLGQCRRRQTRRTVSSSFGRSYDGSRVGVLVPFLDLFNHSVEPVASAGYNPETRAFELVAEREYSRGEQVFIHYGPLPNRELLQHWGFILTVNPHDVLLLRLDDLLPCTYDSVSVSRADLGELAVQLGLGVDIPRSSAFPVMHPSPTTSIYDALPWTMMTWLQLIAVEITPCRCLARSLDVDLFGGNDPICPCVDVQCRRWLHHYAIRKLRLRISPPRTQNLHRSSLITAYHNTQNLILQTIALRSE